MTETFVLGGGCFWCTEAIFSRVRGVVNVRPGYAGGDLPDPTYEQVCEGNTGHAEVVEVVFDREVVGPQAIIDLFFASHDPTTLNRQGNDVGPQYRSIILCTNDHQLAAVQKYVASLNAKEEWAGKIITEIKPLTIFYPAEISHERYYELHPESAYCQVVIGPKLAKVRQKYPNLFKD